MFRLMHSVNNSVSLDVWLDINEPPHSEVETALMMPDGVDMIKAEKIGRECGGEMGGSGI